MPLGCTSAMLDATTLSFVRAIKTRYASTIVTNSQMTHLPHERHWIATISIKQFIQLLRHTEDMINLQPTHTDNVGSHNIIL